jgi:FkbM family methyltransferase
VSFKAEIAQYLASLLDLRVARKGRVGPLLEDDFLERFFPYFEIDCVFDVGANLGQYAKKIRRNLNYKGRIISFEPIPDAAARLRREAEKDSQWVIEEVALDSVSRRAVFNIMHDSEYSSLREPEKSDIDVHVAQTKIVGTVEVRTKTLNELFEKYRKLYGFRRPYIKLDTQGNDLEVVKGGRDVIGNFVGLQSELAFKRIYAESASYREAIDYYESLGFELSAFIPNNAGHFPYLFEMDCIMINKLSLPYSGSSMVAAS